MNVMQISVIFKKKYFYNSMFFSSFIQLTEKGQISQRKMVEVLYFIYNRFCVDKFAQRVYNLYIISLA